MARQEPKQHHRSCRCNACVRRRNNRRRMDEQRYREEGRPLPQGSQAYEIPRDLPPVYDSGSMEIQDIVDAVRSRTNRQLPPTDSDGLLNQHPTPTIRSTPTTTSFPLTTTPPAKQSAGFVIARTMFLVFVLVAFGGGIVYGAVRLGWLQTDSAPAVPLPVLLPTETPKPSELPPTETPSPNATATVAPTPTLPSTNTPSPTPTSTLIPTPTAEVIMVAPTEREIVVNAFAECDGQYSGADQQFRAQAANHAIEEGRQTVANIRELVNKHCGGVFPLLAATNMERPMAVKPTATSAPTRNPTVRPTPTEAPTLRPTPTATINSNGRFNQAEMEAAIHQRINAYRQQQGQTKLEWDNRLAGIAQAHSEDMAKNDRYSHINAAGDDPSARARKAGYDCHNPRSIGVAENIHLLYGHTSTLYGRPYEWETQERMIERFVTDWTNSPGHRRNILDPRYGKTGIGVAFGTARGTEGGIYVTQKFC